MPATRSERLGVMIVVPTLRLGGAERQAALLAAGLDRTRFEPLLVALTSGGPLEPLLEREGVAFRILGPGKPLGSRWLSRLRHPICFHRFRRLVREVRPDVVHAFLPVSNIYAAATARLLRRRAKLIVSKRALGLYKDGHPWLAWAERWANVAADVIHVNSRAVERDVIARERPDPSKLRLIYNGVQIRGQDPAQDVAALRAEWNIPSQAPLIAAVGNLNPHKGFEELVDAAVQVAIESPTAHWVIVGRDDGMGAALRARVDEVGLSGRIHLAGQREDVGRLLHAVDMVVHPSRQEGFSNVILEAMAAARPLIVTDVGGNSEAVVHEELGLVVPPRDPEALAAAMMRLLRDPALAARLAMAAHLRAKESFALDRMVAVTAALYQDLQATEDRSLQ